MTTGTLILLLVGGLIALLVAWGAWSSRQFRAAQRVLRRLKADDSAGFYQYSYGRTCDVTTINGQRTPRRAFVVGVDSAGVVLVPVRGQAEPQIRIAPEQVRWFGRPEKYRYGANALWIHVEQEGQWRLIRLNLDRSGMQTLIRALKPALSHDPDLVTYYRRRRPYVHYGPVQAHPATQDIYGAWELGEPVTLYLMPRYLVVLDGVKVQRVLPRESLQNVAAVQRLDRPGAEGLVRFVSGEESWAFSLPHHGDFAEALAEAARRTLESPVEWQRKKKKPVDLPSAQALDDDTLEDLLMAGALGEGELHADMLSASGTADGELNDEGWLARITSQRDADEDGFGRRS